MPKIRFHILIFKFNYLNLIHIIIFCCFKNVMNLKILINIFFFFSVFGQEKNNRYLINPKSTEGLMKLLDTFLLTITCRGNIVLVSSSVEQYLGHCRVSRKFIRNKNAILPSFALSFASLIENKRSEKKNYLI